MDVALFLEQGLAVDKGHGPGASLPHRGLGAPQGEVVAHDVRGPSVLSTPKKKNNAGVIPNIGLLFTHE